MPLRDKINNGDRHARSEIYIGSHGVVQRMYEIFAEAGCRGDPAGKWILTGRAGGMRGAKRPAATMAGASMRAVECDPSRIDMRLRTRRLDRRADTLDDALRAIESAHRNNHARSVGLLGNAAEVFPELLQRTRG